MPFVPHLKLGNYNGLSTMPDVKRYRLDFAPHLGFPTPATPLFSALADPTPEAQIAFIAAQGFRAVQDPFVASRSKDEQAVVGRAAQASGLKLGCFVYTPMSRAMEPLWSAVDRVGQDALAAEIDAAIEIGRRVGSRAIAVLSGVDPTRSRAEQRYAMTANLARFADRVADAGMILCIEAVNGRRLPQLLLHHTQEAADVVRGAGHPAVRLIFDTAHVQAMDGDILGQLDATWDLIDFIQLADHPDRTEPGTGELNFVRIIDEIEQRKFSGVVELEHMWAVPDAEHQKRYLEWLGRWAA